MAPCSEGEKNTNHHLAKIGHFQPRCIHRQPAKHGQKLKNCQLKLDG